MSNVTDILFSAQDGKLIDNLADRFGLTSEQIEAAVNALLPALQIGLRNAADDSGALSRIIGGAAAPQRFAAFDDAGAAQGDDAVEQGREAMVYLFGSNAAAGQIVQVAARESGLRPDILSQLLPVLVSVALGGLFKNLNSQGLGGILGQLANSGALGSILEQVLGGGGVPGGLRPGGGAPQGGGGLGGGLGGLLGGILGSLLRGGRPAPGGAGPSGAGPSGAGTRGGPPGGGRGGDVLESGPAGPAGMPAGLDPADLQAVIEQIKKTLQPGAGGASAGSAQHSELEDLIGGIFGRRGR